MLVDTNSNWALFYPFTVCVNKCGGSWKTINDPYRWVCVPHKVQKKMNVKVFNLMLGVNDTKFLV